MDKDLLDVSSLLGDQFNREEARRVGHQLIDSRQRYLAIVRRCVATSDVRALKALSAGRCVGHKILHEIATPLTRFRELTEEPFKPNEVAPVPAARALAALGLALVSPPEQSLIQHRIFRRWIEHCGLEVPREPVQEVPAVIETPHVPAIRRLADAGRLDLLSLVWMAALDGWPYPNLPKAVRRGPSVQVLLDRGSQGQLAVLSLSWAPGLPGGLVPDPVTMMLTSADASFQASLAVGWKVAGDFSSGAVLWSLEDRTGPVMRVVNESLSLGFTVLLDERRRLSRPVLGPMTVRRLRPRTAIVGRIDPAAPHEASSVSGYAAKLSVVHQDMRVVLPWADRRAAVEANHKYGDNADLIPVRTWKRAAKKARAVDRRRLLTITVIALFFLAGGGLTLYGESVSRNTAAVRAATADAAARTLLERLPNGHWERLHLDVRAYRTSDGLEARTRLRAWARQLRFAQIMVPTGQGVVNSDGSAAVTPEPDDTGRMFAWDFTANARAPFTIAVEGTGPATAAWLGRDVVAISRASGKTALWNVRTRRLLRQFDVGGDELVSDPTGRWLGYRTADAPEFHVVDLSTGRVRAVGLPGSAVIRGMLTTGELVVAQQGKAMALSSTGSRPLDKRASLRQVIDVGRGQAVVESCEEGRYELFGLESATVLATRVSPDKVCSPTVITPGDRHTVTMKNPLMPRGRDEAESYVVLAAGSARERRVEVPAGLKLIRATVEGSAYRLILRAADMLLVLRVPPPDAMENALIQAQYAIVTPDGRHLVLKYADDRLESWDIAARKVLGTAPQGSAQLSQAGAEGSLVPSPDGRLLVTVFYRGPAKLWRLPDLRPLGRLPLPAASEAFLRANDPEEFSAQVGFVTDELVRVSYGDGISTWNLSTMSKVTEAKISIPDADAPTYWQIVLPELDQVVGVRGDKVQRNRLSDGTLVPGSAFTMGDTPSRDFQDFAPVIDPGGSLIATYHEDAIEIWDLFEHKRVGRLWMADYTVVVNIRFGDRAGDVEFEVKDYRSKNSVGILTQRWHSDPDLIDRILGRTGVGQTADRTVPGVFAWPGTDGAFEPATSRAWLERICQALPDLEYRDELGLPDASWHGPVCAKR
ncbi:hypothetical protein GT755_00395 [Herbidospora sp. NEAU-GS84]|uniref:WD40 repeat domain-containing protein n=1 Tax=Herbidospora solisilvae TaxID=2696284 RepID=A0A7C9NY42_9ACTN|nr:hypothetical protein [Herbidospora solisilvae]NAS20137.1 hypothetical protein [Herbidospora solisilvae]